MTVFFVGAGPGAPDLITVRGQRLIEAAPVVIYAGSLVPAELVACARKDAKVIDSAPLTLDQIIDEITAAHGRGHDVARVHSGDPSIYGAIAEQIDRLKALGIPYQIVPGVPSFAAAAAAIGQELTVPGLVQTVILTRTSERASPMPDRETLVTLAASGAALAIHLSIKRLEKIAAELVPFYGPDCPVVVAYRVSWPDEQLIAGTLSTIVEKVAGAGIARTALILVSPTLEGAFERASSLYSAARIRDVGN